MIAHDPKLAPDGTPSADDPIVLPDEEIAPGIRLLEPIGSGGMAEVWRAWHERLDVAVAVKVIRAPIATPIALDRFALEARVAARLRDPHIVQIFDYGKTGTGFPFIVMELLEGEGLDDYLDVEIRMSPADTVTVGRQLAGALDDVHASDIVHRDLKPGNIWLTHDGHALHAKLIDFGIAHVPATLRAGPKLTTRGQLVGTPVYMSPEQLLRPEHVDAAADRWALAVCLYEMLTGELPFFGGDLPSIVTAILEQRYVPVSSIVSEVDHEIDAFFARAFDTDVKNRFASCRDMMVAFQTAILGESHGAERGPEAHPSDEVVAHAASMPELPVADPMPLTRPAGEPPRPLAAIVAMVVVLIAVLGFGAWRLGPTVSATALASQLSPMISIVELPAMPAPTEPAEPIEPIEHVEQPAPAAPPRPRRAATPPEPSSRVASNDAHSDLVDASVDGLIDARCNTPHRGAAPATTEPTAAEPPPADDIRADYGF